MFGVLDLLTVSLIEKKFKFYQDNPEYLRFMLCGYHNSQEMFDLVGPDYIKHAVDFITNSKINILPYFVLDSKSSPSISVIASGTESQQFIGENAGYMESCSRPAYFGPVIVAEWAASFIEGNVMGVPPELRLDSKLWPGLIVTNGQYSVVIEGIVNSSTLCFKTDLPSDALLTGWRATTAGTNKLYALNASVDSATVQCKLTTTGEAGDHRLLGLVLRNILKSSRLNFDKMGFQNTKISYSAMMVTNQDELEYESVYSITGDCTEHWIDRVVQTLDPASNLNVQVIATSDNPKNGIVKF